MSERIEQGATDGPTREFVTLTVVGGAVGVSTGVALLRHLKDRART